MNYLVKAATRASSGDVPGRTRAMSRRIGAVAAELLPAALVLLLVAGVLELWTRLAHVPVYIVPAPSVVLSRLLERLPFFAAETAVTLARALGGFVLGTGVALIAAVFMAHSRFLERSLMPLAILVKVTPIIAVAPLLTIWLGFGSLPKVLITAMIAFFPVLVNGVIGFRSVQPRALDFLRSLHASRWETFIKLRLPSSLPYLFSAFRVSVPLCLIGALVAEWVGADRGLGHVIVLANANLDMPTLFSAIVVLAVLGISLTMLTSELERRVLFWHESRPES